MVDRSLHYPVWMGALAQLAIHAFYSGTHLIRDLFDISTRHLQSRMAELSLNVPRLTVLLEMRRAGSAERLVCHIGNAGLFRKGFR